jgi:pheromone shutdown protein TraB
MPLALKEGRKVGARIVLGDKPEGPSWKSRHDLNDALDTNEALNEAYCSIYGYSDNMTLGECVHFMSKIGNSKEVNEIKSAIKNLDPKLYKNLYSNREEVMFNSLRYLKGIVVGVVGRDHLDAISKLWEEANEREKILNVSK